MSPKTAKKDPKNEKAIEPAGASKPKKGEKTKEQPVELPLLVEVGFSFSVVFLMLLDALVAYISFISGASWYDIFMRVIVSTIAMGFVLWLFTMNLANGSLSAALKHIEEKAEEQKKKAQETRETSAASSPTDQLGAEV